MSDEQSFLALASEKISRPSVRLSAWCPKKQKLLKKGSETSSKLSRENRNQKTAVASLLLEAEGGAAAARRCQSVALAPHKALLHTASFLPCRRAARGPSSHGFVAGAHRSSSKVLIQKEASGKPSCARKTFLENPAERNLHAAAEERPPWTRPRDGHRGRRLRRRGRAEQTWWMLLRMIPGEGGRDPPPRTRPRDGRGGCRLR